MKNTSLKPQSNNSQSKTYIHEVQNISESIYEDEMVRYINDLSNSIKIIYKSNISNFKKMSDILEIGDQLNNIQVNKEPSEKLVHDTFINIRESFNTFYQNAKEIFRKMKQYRSKKIEIELIKEKENEKQIISNQRGISVGGMANRVHRNTNSNSFLKNNINISNNIIHNDAININGNNFAMIINKTENNINNGNMKIDKLYKENVLLKKQNEIMESTKNNFEEKIKDLNKENEKYKKELEKISNGITKFFANLKEIKNVKYVDNSLKTTLEKEKTLIKQLISPYLKKNSENEKLKNNISISSYDDYQLMKNENIELRKEIEKLKNKTSLKSTLNMNYKGNDNAQKFLKDNSINVLKSEYEELKKKNEDLNLKLTKKK